MTADINQAYGSLVEGVHISGYSLERAWTKLEWLLDEGRWKSVGPGFDDVNAFLETVKLGHLRVAADQRKRIAERIKQLQPEATIRTIAKVMGAGKSSIGEDIVQDRTKVEKSPSKNKEMQGSPVQNRTKLGGDAAAKAVERQETKEERKAEKLEARAQREADLGVKQMALPLKRYGVIYADPPWHFQPYSSVTGMDRAADNHYPTMDLPWITALQVPAADDAVLFLWATVPMLIEALDVMKAWGFAYKSSFVWIKDRIGTGFWARNRHELLLIGVKGKVPAPAMGEQYDSVIEAPVGAHSAKPFKVHEMIETMFPTLPRIELFARERFDGWDAWGNEVQAA